MNLQNYVDLTITAFELEGCHVRSVYKVTISYTLKFVSLAGISNLSLKEKVPWLA